MKELTVLTLAVFLLAQPAAAQRREPAGLVEQATAKAADVRAERADWSDASADRRKWRRVFQVLTVAGVGLAAASFKWPGRKRSGEVDPFAPVPLAIGSLSTGVGILGWRAVNAGDD